MLKLIKKINNVQFYLLVLSDELSYNFMYSQINITHNKSIMNFFLNRNYKWTIDYILNFKLNKKNFPRLT